MLTTLGQELRLAARGLRRSPGFAAVTFATLALGIGATSAMFSVFNAVLLKPLPWREPDRAVMIWSRWNAFDKTWVAAGEVLDYRRRTTTLQGVGEVLHPPRAMAPQRRPHAVDVPRRQG